MTPKWQKLASLAQEICTLWFQFFGAVFASKGYPFMNIFDLAGDWDGVAAVERLLALHYSVDFIVLSFGIMGLKVIYSNVFHGFYCGTLKVLEGH